MVAKAKKLHGSKSARTKSDKRYSKANYEFDVYDDLWQLDANKSLNFELLASLNLDPKFESNFRLVLAAYACEFSSSYTDNLFRYCRWFFAVGVTEKINEEHVINYKATPVSYTHLTLPTILLV